MEKLRHQPWLSDIFHPELFLLLLILLQIVGVSANFGTCWRSARRRWPRGVEDARVAAEARANAEKRSRGRFIAAAQGLKPAAAPPKCRARGTGSQQPSATGEERPPAKLLKGAEEDARLERERHLADLRGQIGALAVWRPPTASSAETLDEQRQRVLIQELFSGVKAGKGGGAGRRELERWTRPW